MKTCKEANLENVYKILKEKRLSKYDKIKQEEEEKFLRACTFKPEIQEYHGILSFYFFYH